MGRIGWSFPVAALAAAIVLAIAGGVLLVNRFGEEAAPAQAELHGLIAAVGRAGWSTADHVMPIPSPGGPPGYQMPPQMMPGMPTGDDARLSIPITLRNTTNAGLSFDAAAEFVLRGGAEDGPRTSRSDTFGELTRLGSGSAVNGVLYFDAKAPGVNDPPLYLEWARDGQVARIAVSLDGTTTPDHH